MYLDIDGVINASKRPAFEVCSTKAVFITDSGMKRKFWMDFAPEVITTLDQIREEYQVELVFLSTWCHEMHVLKLPRAFNGLFGGRVLEPASLPFGEEDPALWTAWKAEMLLADQVENPLPFSWLDDEAVPVHGDKFGSEDAFLLAPDPRTGLTSENLTDLVRFHASR